MKIEKINRLTEGTRYDQKAAKIISDSGLFDETTSASIIDALFRQDIHAFVHAPNWLEKYLKGIARMLVEEAKGSQSKAREFLNECPAVFERYLTWVKANREKEGAEKIDDAFVNKMHYQDVLNFLDKMQADLDEQSKDELSKMTFDKPSNYTLVPIDSYNQMHELYGGTLTGNGVSGGWCHTNGENTYNSWINRGDGNNKFFVLQNNDWKNIPFDAKSNAENPKDAYGNSLIAILVNKYGKLANATLRCNHEGVPTNADNQYVTYAELSKIAGFNVEEEVAKNIPEYDPLMKYFDISDGILYKYEDNETITKLIIPSNITSIGSYAFKNCAHIKEVIIPGNVITVEHEAFSGCLNLTSVTVLEGTTTFESSVFSDCINLTDVKLPNSLTHIGNFAFDECESLHHIDLPKNLISIGMYAFSDCTELSDITIPGTLELITGHSFSSCTNLEHVTISDGVKCIGDSAFSRCSNLKKVEIPNSVTEIKDSAFSFCYNLQDIYLSNNITNLEKYVFMFCGNVIIHTDNEYVINYCEDHGIKYELATKKENLNISSKLSISEALRQLNKIKN